MRQRIWALVCCAMSLSPWALAQPAGNPLGLMDAYDAARANDAKFRSARAERAAGMEYEAIGRAKLRPTASVYLSDSRNHAVVSNAAGARQDLGNYSSSANSLQLRQPLYDRDAWAVSEQGAARSAASEASYRSRLQELAVRVSEAYMQALLALDQVQLVEAQLDTLDGLYRANELRFSRGEGTKTEMLETGAKRALVQTRLYDSRDAALNRRKTLEAMLGMPVQELQRLRAFQDHSVSSDVEAFEVWKERAIHSNPELESLRHSATVAQAELQRMEAGHHPRVDLVMSVGRSESDTVSTFRQSSSVWAVGVQVSIPLYSGGGVSAQVRQALAMAEKASADLAARQAELEVELHRQFNILNQGPIRLRALHQSVQAQEASLEATAKSLAGGERTNADVLDARERLSQAQRDLLEARYAYLLAGLRIRYIAGVLEDGDVLAISRQFDTAR
jgi:protease secretion system outer membrane protein